MKKPIRTIAWSLLVLLLLIFIVTTIRRASGKYPPVEPAILNTSPLVFYGQTQPQGREIRVSPKLAGIVRTVPVREGEFVRKEQILCKLDDTMEKKELDAALSRVASARKAAEMSSEKWGRSEALYRGKGITESEYVQTRLQKELAEAEIVVRQREAELAEVLIEERRILSPIEGIVYKCDLRPGETFQPGDRNRILLGSPVLELRCDLETFWIGRLDMKTAYSVFHAETGEPLGKAAWVSASRYLRPKDVLTEDPQDRKSAVYQEIVMRFLPDRPGLPIGLPVMVRVEEAPSKNQSGGK